MGTYIVVAFVLAVALRVRTKSTEPTGVNTARVLAGGAGLWVGACMSLMLVLADSTDKSVLPMVLAFATFLVWGITSVMKLQAKLDPS